jgi:lysyl-tRNA synthetase class 2
MAEAERRRLSRLKPNLERRALIYRHIRSFFQDQGFLEIETPIRMPEVAPEQHIAPCAAEDWLLSTSPELHMKRLLAAGYDKIFQFGRCFRKGERGRWHNPEFTLLEWYRSGGSYEDVISDTERLFAAVAAALNLKNVGYQGKRIDLSLPWPQVTVSEAFRKSAGWDPTKELTASFLDSRPDAMRDRNGVRGVEDYFEKFDVDLVMKVVPDFASDRPTILLDYPAALGSLARLKPGNPAVAERAEVFIGGLELANAFSELNDPAEQTRRFNDEIRQIGERTGVHRGMPRKFLKALRGMPDCAGIALGIDRMVMLFCDADTIDDVMPFTSDKI